MQMYMNEEHELIHFLSSGKSEIQELMIFLLRGTKLKRTYHINLCYIHKVRYCGQVVKHRIMCRKYHLKIYVIYVKSIRRANHC